MSEADFFCVCPEVKYDYHKFNFLKGFLLPSATTTTNNNAVATSSSLGKAIKKKSNSSVAVPSGKELSKYDAWQQLKMFQRSLSIDSIPPQNVGKRKQKDDEATEQEDELKKRRGPKEEQAKHRKEDEPIKSINSNNKKNGGSTNDMSSGHRRTRSRRRKSSNNQLQRQSCVEVPEIRNSCNAAEFTRYTNCVRELKMAAA